MVTAGAFLGRWRLMSIDGVERDVPDTAANAAFFGFAGTGKDGAPGAFPKAGGVTVNECASHAAVLAAIGPGTAPGRLLPLRPGKPGTYRALVEVPPGHPLRRDPRPS
jgi:hypothetical protein